jgi:hypothetical protein
VSRRAFEKSLELLSGLFSYLYGNFIPFDFVASFNEWRRIRVPVDPASLRMALATLARAKTSPSHDFQDLLRAFETQAGSSATVVVVSSTPSRYWSRRLPALPVPVICMDTRDAGLTAPSETRAIL